MNDYNILDSITSSVSAFSTFNELVNAEGYRPTIRCGKYAPKGSKGPERRRLKLLADAYDVAMELRNDSRRAFRG